MTRPLPIFTAVAKKSGRHGAYQYRHISFAPFIIRIGLASMGRSRVYYARDYLYYARYVREIFSVSQ